MADVLVQDLINAAMRQAGVLASGESPSTNEQNDAFFSLNRMMESWSLERLLVPSITRQVLTLPANSTGAYQIGPGAADFPNVVRPVQIERAGFLLNQGSVTVEIPLRILNDGEWADLEVKNVPSLIPSALYWDQGYPYSTLYTWPAINNGGYLALYTWQPFGNFVALTDVVNLPSGYMEAIITNLAVRLSIEYGQSPNPALVQLASDLKDRIKNSNPAEFTMRSDALVGRGRSFNIYTGEAV